MQSSTDDLDHAGPPFPRNQEDRGHARARLDALFFTLYDIGREDAGYILPTFPIVREQDKAAFGRFRTRDLILGYTNAFAAGDAQSRVLA